MTAGERLTPEEWVTLEILKVMVRGLRLRTEPGISNETDTQRMRQAVRIARAGACELLHTASSDSKSCK